MSLAEAVTALRLLKKDLDKTRLEKEDLRQQLIQSQTELASHGMEMEPEPSSHPQAGPSQEEYDAVLAANLTLTSKLESGSGAEAVAENSAMQSQIEVLNRSLSDFTASAEQDAIMHAQQIRMLEEELKTSNSNSNSNSNSVTREEKDQAVKAERERNVRDWGARLKKSKETNEVLQMEVQELKKNGQGGGGAEEEIQSLKQANAKGSEVVKQLRAKIVELTASGESQGTENGNLLDELSVLQSECESLKGEKVQVEIRLGEKMANDQANKTLQQEENGKLNDELVRMREAAQDSSTNNDQANKTLQEENGKLKDELVTIRQTVQSNSEANDQANNELQQQNIDSLSTAEQSLATAQSTITSLNNQLSTLQSTSESLQTDITQLNSTISSNKLSMDETKRAALQDCAMASDSCAAAQEEVSITQSPLANKTKLTLFHGSLAQCKNLKTQLALVMKEREQLASLLSSSTTKSAQQHAQQLEEARRMVTILTEKASSAEGTNDALRAQLDAATKQNAALTKRSERARVDSAMKEVRRDTGDAVTMQQQQQDKQDVLLDLNFKLEVSAI